MDTLKKDEQQDARQRPATVPRWLRVFLASGALIWGLYWMLLFRTMGWGPTSLGFEAGVSIALPIALIGAVSFRPLRTIAGTILIIAICLSLSEGIAGAEEYLFRREVANMTEEQMAEERGCIWRERLWPFEHHNLMYVDETGEFTGND